MGLGCYNTVLQRIGNIDVLIPMEVCKIINKIIVLSSHKFIFSFVYVLWSLFNEYMGSRKRPETDNIIILSDSIYILNT